MEKIRNLSIKKSILLYLTCSLLCSFLLSAWIILTATHMQQQIWWKYMEEDSYSNAAQADTDGYRVSITKPSRTDMSATDLQLSELCDFLETYTILFLSIAGSGAAIALFYRNKLQIPLEELREASRMIAKDQLNFHISYKNQDELGQLCLEFEKMRAQLEENMRTTWHMAEEEKALRAAIAHDIRSPLAVLKGYQEMLLLFVPDGTLTPAQTIEMLQEGMHQIERMDRFIETMRELTKLEERELRYAEIPASTLLKQLQKEITILSKDTTKECLITPSIPSEHNTLCIDREVVLEVTENLLSNALRYAHNQIELILSINEQELIITIQDDGIGFTENSDQITKAFYHANPQDDLQHFGLGMYISRIYCERHGGRLFIGNQTNGGAIVKAVFKMPSL